VRLPFAPVYVMQLATGYMNVALPSNFARMAINIRFFQRHGVPPAAAVTSGAIDSFASTIIQALLLALLLLFSESSLDFDLDLPSGPSVTALVALVALALLGVAVLVAIRRVRRAITGRVRAWWPEVRDAVKGLRATNKLALLIGGSLATEILFATALGIFANAVGYDIGLADLLVINISVSLLASFVPVPGGIGVAEFGLTVGLVAAGMPDEAAFATAILYRVATFYVPPLWGFFAMRWLQRNSLL
jgi:glycosyltransferase 2 family protein